MPNAKINFDRVILGTTFDNCQIWHTNLHSVGKMVAGGGGYAEVAMY